MQVQGSSNPLYLLGHVLRWPELSGVTTSGGGR